MISMATTGDEVELDVLESKLAKLRRELRAYGSVVVAFSGGVDSALLAWIANDELGPNALAVTAVSPSLAASEADDCRALAVEWGLNFCTVDSEEMARAAYRVNDADRCYHCKAELMDIVVPIAAATDATVVLGVNVDDLDDHRPGQRAASEAGARFPFVDVGLSKADIRAASRLLDLRTWNKPAAACLASRIPHGTEVSVEILSRVERAEDALRRLGFGQCRVRHYSDTARLEFEIDQLGEVLQHRVPIIDAVRSAGYRYVTVDLEGFRSGNLNPVEQSGRRSSQVDPSQLDPSPVDPSQLDT